MNLFRILLLISTAIIPVVAQPPDELSPFLIRQISVLIQSQMAEEDIPGLSVAVARQGRICFATGFGMADLEASVPATAETAYRTASIAQSMTATAVLLLMEQGKINLDEPIQTMTDDHFALVLIPEGGTAVAVMCNLQNANLNPIVEGIQRLLKESR